MKKYLFRVSCLSENVNNGKTFICHYERIKNIRSEFHNMDLEDM